MQGKTINGFTLQRLLGTGGMAEVWYAENEIHKQAAVKILNEDLAHNANIVERFRNEAEIMVKLNHPNIRQVYGYGEIDGRPTIVMEYLEGDDLKARMKRGQRFTDEELKKWWDQLVDALNYTHKKGIVHRDIKPGNIFVDGEGNIKLLDFGIAKVRESISSTQTGQKLGTLMYMSPEQVKDSKHIDYRTDVYSLAVTYVHLLTGKKPYNSDTTSDFEISEQIVYKPLDLSGVPAEWQVFLAPYLNKEPDQRPALRCYDEVSAPTDADDSDDEGTIVGDVPIQPTQNRPVSQTKSKKGLWIGLGVLAAVVVVLVLLLMPKADQIKQEDEATQFVDQYVADNIPIAETLMDQQEDKWKAEKEEDSLYHSCTTIPDCDNYLLLYPNGRYVEEVKALKGKMEKEASKGVFSVSASKKVRFASGNLQHQPATKKWRFASHPYDIIGSANENYSDTYDGWVDLFTWGSADDPAALRGNNKFADWGKNKINNGGGKKWHTLSKNEWNYVINKRNTSSGIRFAKAKVNGVSGLVLLPDDWEESIYSLKNTNQAKSGYVNTISVSQWKVLEDAGVVFLPNSGSLDVQEFSTQDLRMDAEGNILPSEVWMSLSYDDGETMGGLYWSASQAEFMHSYSLLINKDCVNSGNSSYCRNGLSVRLVTSVQ